MRNRIQVAIVVAIVFILACLAAPVVWSVREAAARSRCHNNLRQLALAMQNYQDYAGAYPRGTVADSGLPPERRLSGYVELWSFLQGGWKWLLDPRKPWDDEANSPTWADCKTFGPGIEIGYEQRIIGRLPVFLCSANPQSASSDSPSMTHYVGVAGVGVDAAAWPVEHAGAGVFGYDRSVRPSDIADGKSNTMALIETSRDNGPWTAGGFSTVRGLDPQGLPYLGREAQFTTWHRQVNAAFLDGTVRSLSTTMDPRVLEAMATVAGGEPIP